MLSFVQLQAKVSGQGRVCVGRDKWTGESCREWALWIEDRGGEGKMWLVMESSCSWHKDDELDVRSWSCEK